MTVEAIAAQVEGLVREVEAGTSAEVIVVVAGSSGSYGQPLGWLAAGVSLVATGFFCWSPWVFDDRWIPLDVVAVTGLVVAAVAVNAQARAFLAGSSARRRAVALAADAAFWQEAAHATRGRTGVLVYVSVLEGMVLVRADTAIQVAVPADRWNAAVGAVSSGSITQFGPNMRALGALLAASLPRAADDVNESPDAARVRR